MKLDPSKILMFAALGFGAYYLTTRSASAQTARVYQPTTAPNLTTTQQKLNTAGQALDLVDRGLNAITSIFSTFTQPKSNLYGLTTDATGTPINFGTIGAYFSQDSAPSFTNDGWAVNPVYGLDLNDFKQSYDTGVIDSGFWYTGK